MTKNKRIEVVDAVRGFAILCILLLHSSNHFLYNTMPDNSPAWLKRLDESTKQVLYFLFEGKAFGIFAILFGFTFGIQYFRAQERGDDFRLRFLWRMLLLAGFGYINAAFFAGGDPLVFMAIVAIILPIVAGVSTRTLIVIAVILFMQPLELYKAVSLWLNPDYQTTNYTGQLYQLLVPFVKEGNFGAMVWSNITTGLKACLAWACEYGRITQTPALYIVGFLFYKQGLFANIDNRFWNKLTLIASITTPLLFFVKSIQASCQPIQIATGMWYNLSFIFLLLAGFVLLFRTGCFKRLTFLFQIYGKMSLSNFVFQSIIGTFLFYPYGLHLSTQFGIFASVLIGITIAVIQVIFSDWWLKEYKQGPFEFLWHRATYLT